MAQFPGYNYLGPGNYRDDYGPLNRLDRIAQRHDYEYGQQGWQSYLYHNPADERFLQRSQGETGPAAAIARGFFKLKKAVAPYKSFGKKCRAPWRRS